MPFKSSNEVFANRVFTAREDVAKAEASYRKGGSPDALNEANSALAEAHCRLREAQGGNVPDDRY